MFMNILVLVVAMISVSAYAQLQKPLIVSEVMEQANDNDWREVDNRNVLKITLPTGVSYIELNSQLAPKHTANIKALAKQGFYQGLSVYRFVEGFVAQGGDSSGKKTSSFEVKPVPAEFYLATSQPLPITVIDRQDGYAPITGFLNGFAVAQNKQQTQTWQVHCPSVFAMARNNEIDSASTEFYVTIGNSQRYLDRNITVFGRVLEGIEHFNLLARHPENNEVFNPITDVQLLSDISDTDNSKFRVMKTNSNVFKNLIQARKNRTESWFVESANYIDVCAMPIPTERASKSSSPR